MRWSETASLALGSLAAVAVAQACVVDVPWQLFNHRQEIRDAKPVNSFAWAASHLVAAPNPAVPLPEHADDSYEQRRTAAEVSGLSQAQHDAVLAMRAAPGARLAFDAGSALPASIRLYTAGAVAFVKGDAQTAAGNFRQVLNLPSAVAAPRAVWAAYMLARLASAHGDLAGAAAGYRQTRALAAQGGLDPLGLATASLGDEARLRLDAGDGPAAVALYAEQAARGSGEAVQSLRLVAEGIMAQPERLLAAVRDPLTQRLLVVHALALTGDYLHALHAGGTLYQIDADGFWPPNGLDTHPLQVLFNAIRSSRVTVAGTDQLAALAYQLYDFDAARALAAASGTPLALWIRAKLALELGDDSAMGARLMAQAVRASAQAGGAASLEPSSVDLLHGEAAVWALGRGDFIQAMQVLWPAAWTYWGDVAYLAERVLTTDELKAFVDGHAPMAEPLPADPSASNAVNLIRDLLARRLMRDGRYDEAPPYFDHPAQGDADTGADAIAFTKALRRSQSAFWASDRAQAGWAAAVLLRTRGMEMMDTETSPDFGGTSGGMENWGYGPGPGGPLGQPDTFVQDELIRYDASRPMPDLRYHYRYLAVDQALQAADELPSRSQASAAILCQAAGWMFSSHADEKARVIYRRYVGTGAVLPFATHFDRACPEPDFAAVSATREKLVTLEVRDAIHRHKDRLAAAAVLLAVAVAAAMWARRRRN